MDLLGDDFILSIDSASAYVGNFTTPTWVTLTDIGDLGKNFNPTRVEIPKRLKFKFYKSGRSDLTFTWSMNIDPANATIMAIIAAIESGAPIHCAISNGPIATAGTVYYHGMMHLVGPEDYAQDKNASVDVEGKPHADASATPPAKVTVT